jgi:hypothetical protein
MSVKIVKVDSTESLKFTTTSYLAKGFVVANSTSDRVTLQKKKVFNMVIGIIGFLACVVGLVVYAIYYSTLPDAEIVEICVEPAASSTI